MRLDFEDRHTAVDPEESPSQEYTALGKIYHAKIMVLPNSDTSYAMFFCLAMSSVWRRYTAREDYAAGGKGEMLCSCDSATQCDKCKQKLKVLRMMHPDLSGLENHYSAWRSPRHTA